MKYKAVFLENDSTIKAEISKTENPAIEFNDDVVEGLQLLQSYGYLLVVVSNSDSSKSDATNIADKQQNILYDSFAHLGIYLDGFFYGWQNSPGIIQRAGDEMDIDLSQSWMVGDIPDDIEAGKCAGCKSIMINKGNETTSVSGNHRPPVYFAGGLTEASKFIVATH